MFGGTISMRAAEVRGVSLINARRGAFTVGALHDDRRRRSSASSRARTSRSRSSASPASRIRRCRSPSSRWRPICSSATKWRPWPAWPAPAATPGVLIFIAADRRARRARSATRRSSSASRVLDLVGAVVLWTVVRERRPDSTVAAAYGMTTRSAIRSFAASIPIRRSCASATTTTSRRRRSSGIPGVQIHHSRDLVHWRLLTRPLRAREPAQHARRSRFVRHLGAVPHARRRPLLSDLHRREALRPHRRRPARRGASLRDFHNYLVTSRAHRRRLVRSDLSQQQRLRSVAVSRRRRPQVSRQHAVGSSARAESLRRHRAAGVFAGEARAGRRAANYLRGHVARLHRGAASLQARRLVLSAHGRRRHGLGPRRDDGALADDRRARTSCIPTSTS